jgi:hypothetical protein
MCVNSIVLYRTGIDQYSGKIFKKTVLLLCHEIECLAAVKSCFRARDNADQRERFLFF